MNFNEYAFPHPVLGLHDDIEGHAISSIECDGEIDPENYLITVTYKVENPDIITLLNEEKVYFLCEVSCTSTIYRKAEITSNSIQFLSIPKNSVRDKVDLLLVLVSKNPISNYSNSKAHKDFNGYSFDLDEGDILAYLGYADFIAGIAYQNLKAVSSFMEIEKGSKKKGDFVIILDNPKVLIQLSQDDYEKYCDPRICKNPKMATIIHSAIVFPTLIDVLYKLHKDAEQYYEYPWAQRILSRISNDMEFRNLPLNEDNILKLAQLFLGGPIERLIDDLFNQKTSNEDND